MYRKYGVGKILALVKTLQQRRQKSRSYNTTKELMENDSKRKSLGKRGSSFLILPVLSFFVDRP